MVFDTMVLAYALLGVSDFCEDSLLAIDKAKEIWAPDSLRAEMANVIWQWVHFKKVPIKVGIEVFWDVEGLLTQAVPTNRLWEDALELSVSHAHSVYDTLFVSLAVAKDLKMITWDQIVLKKFPEYTLSVPEFVAPYG